MEGVRRVAAALNSKVEIEDIDLDAEWVPDREYGLALFLGTLYQLKTRSPSWNGYPCTPDTASRVRASQAGARTGLWSLVVYQPRIYSPRTSATATQPIIGYSRRPAWCAWLSGADGACVPPCEPAPAVPIQPRQRAMSGSFFCWKVRAGSCCLNPPLAPTPPEPAVHPECDNRRRAIGCCCGRN